MPQPQLIKGSAHKDERGKLKYNNAFDLSPIKRFYTIEPESADFKRGWQGHKIEQRWFSAIKGSFKIQLIEIDNWNQPSKNLEKLTFVINAEKLDFLHVPHGYVSSIQSMEEDAIILVFSNHLLGEVKDEYRYEADYFI